MSRGRPKNPVTQNIKLARERRSLIRNLRDGGLAKGYAEGMNVHTLANLFGKDPAVAHQRIGVLKGLNPSIETQRKEVLLRNKALGIKKPKEVSAKTLEKRARIEIQKNTKALLKAKNQEGVLKRNSIIAQRYSQGAIGGDLINGMGISVVEGINIARKAAENNPVLEYKRRSGLQRMLQTGTYSERSVTKALSWIRSDLASLGENMVAKNPKLGKSVSEIRSSVGLSGKANMRKEVSPNNFMFNYKLTPKTMMVLTTAFLTSFNKKTRSVKNSFDIANEIRKKIPSLPEQLIQNYSNWVYTFTNTKGNRSKLVAFRKQIQKGNVK